MTRFELSIFGLGKPYK